MREQGEVSPQTRAEASGRRLMEPARLRLLLQRMGPTFIKIGQFLALRPDLVPQEYCDELLKLVDHVEPFPYRVARRFITEDLGAPPEELFAWINPRPVAAASLAQVHHARTHDGEDVAVKVQRPDVRELVRRDLRRARLLGRLIDLSGLIGSVSVPDLVAEFSRWISDELDMELELRNLTRMYELAGDVPSMIVPHPFPPLSGRRILTAEFLRGIPFSELLRMAGAGEAARLDDLGVDRDLLASRLIHTILVQIFRFQFFHADTHPGNLLAMPDNVVGFVDFGLTETLEATYRPGILRFVSAVYVNDADAMLYGLLEVLQRGEDSDVESFRADFMSETRTWLRERDRARPGSAPSERSPTGQYMMSVLRAAHHNNMRIPAGVLSMYRALLTAETVANQLGASVDLRSVGRSFFFRLQAEEVARRLEPSELQPLAAQFLDLLREGPGQLRRLLSDLADDRFVLRVRTSDTAESRRQANARAKLIAASVLTVGIAVLLAGSGQTVVRGVRLSDVLFVVLALLYAWLLLLWRRLR